MNLNIALLHPAAKIPARASPIDAAYDLSAIEMQIIPPRNRALIGTGLAINILPGFVGLIFPRSGLAVRNGIQIGAGVIDPGYTGEIKVLLFNNSDQPFTVNSGDRIAQMLFMPRLDITFTTVDSHDHTDRGVKGFGSSGV